MLSQGEGCSKDVGRVGRGGGVAANTSKVPVITNFINLHTWARILSDRNVFWTPRGRGKTAGSNAPGAFLVFFFWWSLAPDLCSVKTILAGNFRSFRVYSPEFS